MWPFDAGFQSYKEQIGRLASKFAGKPANQTYLYLYSKFGDPNGNNDGYEEWAAVVGPNTPSGVPLPASLWGGVALLGAMGAAKIRSRRRSA